MRVLVTGAAGFVGAHLVRTLAGHRGIAAVLATDLAPDLAAVAASADIEHRTLDVCDRDAVRAVLASFRPDAVIHAAAITPPPDADAGTARRVAQVNVEGAHTLLDLASRSGTVRRIVVLSSAAVFGGPVEDRALPEETVPHPRGVYGASKVALENVARRLGAQHGVEMTVMRLASVYGAGERATASRPHPSFVHRLVHGPAPVRVAGGDVTRDWIDADDAAAAVAALLTRLDAPRALYHLGGGEAVGWWRLVEAAAAAGLRVERSDPAAADLLSVAQDARPLLAIDRIKADISFAPRSIEDGIRALVAATVRGGRP